MTFDKRQTNIAKGVALLLLLWHHLFYNNPDHYEHFSSAFLYNGVPIESLIADLCKVCVSIFLILSGYGLYKSWLSYMEKNKVVVSPLCRNKCLCNVKLKFDFVKKHLLKLMLDYWFIYIVFVPMGIALAKPFWGMYDANPIYAIIDFCGLANLFNTATMNPTWWFMSVIIIYYIVFPLLAKIFDYSSELLVIISFALLVLPYMPQARQVLLWLFPFVFGMYLAKYNGFDRLSNKVGKGIGGIITCLFAIVITAYFKYAWIHRSSGYHSFDTFFACVIILVSFCFLSKIPVLNKILEELGKYSGMIFMFHTFIFSLYFKDFIYWFKYPVVILVVLTVVCYVIARLLRAIMHLVRYDKLIGVCIK